MPLKLCECGCGLPVPIARRTDRRNGLLKGCPGRFIKGHNRKDLAPIQAASPAPVAAALPEANAAPVQASLVASPTPQTAEEYRAAIALINDALRVLESQCSKFTKLLIAEEGVQPAGIDGESTAKLLRENVLTANVQRKEKKRLQSELQILEAANVKPIDPRQALKAKLEKLKGLQP